MNKYLFLLTLLLAVNSANAKKVSFAVDMTGLPVNTTGIHVAGDFQEEAGYEGGDWQSNTTEMFSQDGSAIYSVVVDIPAFAKYEFKFINGDQWYEVEFVPLESRVGYDFNDSRWVYIDSLYNDTTFIPPVLFSGNAPAAYYLLRLKVDMQLVPEISSKGVHVAGGYQGWEPTSSILYSFTEKVYEKIEYVSISEGYAEYRYLNGNTEGDYEIVPGECAVNGNRTVNVTHDTVMETVCFAECQACTTQFISEDRFSGKPRIFPNPCKQLATLEFNGPETIHNVAIIDIFGKVVRHYEGINSPSFYIKRENLPAGIYFVRIENADHWLSTLRLVISD
jgi:hypothetical protein